MPDPAIAPLVGDWDATELELTDQANPETKVDLVAEGAAFSLNIQPSGQYTAILVIQPRPQTEVGQIDVDGSRITLSPTIPADQPTTTGVYSLTGDVFTLDGLTTFDFDADGVAQPAALHIRFVRR